MQYRGMRTKSVRTKAFFILCMCLKVGIRPQLKTDSEMMKLKGVGKAILAEIRAMTGPVVVQ